MSLKYILILFFANFVSLIGVSAFLLGFLVKKKVAEKSKSIKILMEQEQKMQFILEEVTKVSSLLYRDIKNKELVLQKLIDKASDKISIMEGLASATYEVKEIPEQFNVRSTTTDQIRSIHKASRVDPVHKKIFELSSQGFSIIDISRMVSKHKGEVELILNLHHAMLKY